MDDANRSEPTPVDDRSEPSPAEAIPTPGDPVPDVRRGRAASERLSFAVPRLPEDTDAWLHVVSGPSDTAVARGALDLAGRFLAGSQRVLIIDGGPRLRLHARFAGEARWGVIECLTGELPVLGLVQETGQPNLYMLTHGLPASRTHWAGLGRLLEEARPHFARTVLALDADAPAAIGDALAGWHLEGWWAGGARAGRRAVKMADRLAIHLCDLDLTATPEARLEALDARLRGRESAPTLSDEAVVQERLDALTRDAVDQALTAGPGEGATVTPPGAQAIPPPPVVLECDLQVRERLRFLLWMRRIQSDELRAEIARPARVAPPGPARP